jgi:hypothetical protein
VKNYGSNGNFEKPAFQSFAFKKPSRVFPQEKVGRQLGRRDLLDGKRLVRPR